MLSIHVPAFLVGSTLVNFVQKQKLRKDNHVEGLQLLTSIDEGYLLAESFDDFLWPYYVFQFG